MPASIALIVAAATVALTLGTSASAAEVFKGANVDQGHKLYQEHNCAQCHAQKVGGDGNAIYKPSGKLETAGLLRGMVEQCNTSLNLGMFPEEVTDVAAYLNQHFYKHSK